MNSLPYDPTTVEVGDIVQLPWVRSYQHGATMIVTRVLRATFDAQEIKGSYGGPITEEESRTTHSHCRGPRQGRMWRIHKRHESIRRPHNVMDYVDTNLARKVEVAPTSNCG
jgi:hypothetical protein